MSNFYYTNAVQHRGKIYLRGINDGEPFKKVLNYKPYLFLPSNEDTGFKTVYGKNVKKKTFDSISKARKYLDTFKDISNTSSIYGMQQFLYPFIYDNFKGDIKYNPQDISVASVDIETSMAVQCSFDVAITEAPNEITAITISKDGKRYTFGTKDFDSSKYNGSVTYFKCASEEALLESFLSMWNSPSISPDIVTGWNIEGFDVPYLVVRITKILGIENAKKLSPWGLLREFPIMVKGKMCSGYELQGIATLDYMILYKKFVFTPQESYKLDHIAFMELGEQKIDYSEYDNLDDLYRRNPQLYVEYNIMDTELIDKLEAKLKLIELVMAIAYSSKTNYTDALTSIRNWDVLIHNYLMDRNVVVEPTKNNVLTPLVGGYVKEPIVGMHKWAMYLDLTSLYPHLIMQYNISPEKFVRRQENFESINDILMGKIPTNNGNSITANGCEYLNDSRGFLPAIMKRIYQDRKDLKNQMLEVKAQYEETKDKSLLNEIARLNNLQLAKKVNLNSGYGACANIYFRWFDFNVAESVTMSGQLTIQWIEKKLNAYFNDLLGTTGYAYVVYLDTDSAVLRLDKLVERVMPNETDHHKITAFLYNVYKKKLVEYLAESYDELAKVMNAYENVMHMKLESISSKLCMLAKKKYLMNVYNDEGLVLHEPKLKMTGIQAIQSTTPQICKDALKDCFKVIMNGEESELQSYISKFKAKFNKSGFGDIARTTGVNAISTYKMNGTTFESGTPFHVKGALVFNNMIKKHNIEYKYEAITDGDKIKTCYLNMPNPTHISVIASSSDKLPVEFNLDGYIDYKTQFEKTFVQPITPILDTIGWSMEKKHSIGDFLAP